MHVVTIRLTWKHASKHIGVMEVARAQGLRNVRFLSTLNQITGIAPDEYLHTILELGKHPRLANRIMSITAHPKTPDT